MRYFCTFIVLVSTSSPAVAQWVEQSLSLRAGWNSVFLWVDPANNRADALFDGTGITMISRLDPSNSSRICNEADSGCVSPSGSTWLTWRPSSHPASFANSLRVIEGGHVYLIEARNSTKIVIAGRPCTTKTQWTPGPNLVGAFVTPQAPPTFATYLEPSDAHLGAQVFQLSGSHWTPMNTAQALVDADTGYWITATKASEYSGPVEIDDATLRGIDFARGLSEHPVTLRSRGSQEPVTLKYLPPAPNTPGWAGDVPLVIREFVESEEGSQFAWNPLDTYSVDLATAPRTLRLGMDRANLAEATLAPDGTGEAYQGLLSVTDQNGFQRFIALRGQVSPDAGLWVGTVTVDQVAWVHASLMGEPELENEVPRPTASPFTFRVIMHVDDMDNVRLLSEVMLLWDEGLPPSGGYVLVTSSVDPTYLAQLKPTGLQDGQSFTRRISSANYSIPGTLTTDVDSGPFGAIAGSPLKFTLNLAADDPLNPFKHAYHPDHDCVDNASGETLADCDDVGESYDIARTLSFSFTGQQQDTWVGSYAETLTGLNKGMVEIKVGGSFELARVSTVPSLNGM